MKKLAMLLLFCALWGSGQAREAPLTITVGEPSGLSLLTSSAMNIQELSQLKDFPETRQFRFVVRGGEVEGLLQALPARSQLCLCLPRPQAADLEVVRRCRSRIRAVEIGDEANHLEVDKFFQDYHSLAVALKREFPELLVGGPGLLVGHDEKRAGFPWLNQFLAMVRETSAPLDFVSWKMQVLDPAQLEKAARDIATTARGIPTYCTYYNTHIGRCGELYELRQNIAGATQMNEFRRALSRAGVQWAFSGTPSRSAAQAFKLWCLWNRHPNLLRVSDPAALAGYDDQGEVAVLLSNPSKQERTLSLKVRPGKATLWTTSDSSPALEQRPLDLTRPFTVGARTMALVVIR